MSFKDVVHADVKGTFLNLAEFGEYRNIWYDGTVYENVAVVLSGLKENDRKRLVSGVKEQGGRNSVADRVQGLYNENIVLHCAAEDLGGKQPENGARFRISKTEGGRSWREYRVVTSVSDMGMFRVELAGLTE